MLEISLDAIEEDLILAERQIGRQGEVALVRAQIRAHLLAAGYPFIPLNSTTVAQLDTDDSLPLPIDVEENEPEPVDEFDGDFFKAAREERKK